MLKKYIAYVLIVGGLVGGVCSAALFSRKASAPVLSGSNPGPTDYSRTNVNVDDPRYLMGLNHEVFVGKVLHIVGYEKYPGYGYTTSTQFEVRVIYNIKGNLQGTATLAQLLPDKTVPLAHVGSTYVFAAQYNTDSGWYTFAGPARYKLLSDDATLSDADLKVLAENNATVLTLQKAYPNELFSGFEMRDPTTAYNSYASRHYDASGNLIDDTVVLHEQYLAAHPSISTEPSPAAPANAPVNNSVASPVPSDTPISSPEASIPPSDTPSVSPSEVPASDSVSPTATPEASTTPTDTSSPAPSPSDSSVPAAS